VFRSVHGVEEAFHPGFEPKLQQVSDTEAADQPTRPGAPPLGPAPVAVTPIPVQPVQPAKPPKKKVPDDLNGLY
jgi:hypothetical protein